MWPPGSSMGMQLSPLQFILQGRMLRGWEEIRAWFEEQGFPKDGGVSIRTLQRWERDRGFPVFRLGRRVYSHPQKILDWLFEFQERGAFYGVNYHARRYYREEIKVHRAMESEDVVAGAVPVASE